MTRKAVAFITSATAAEMSRAKANVDNVTDLSGKLGIELPLPPQS
ncbi:MAG: hypothetical protein ACHWZW_11115 [Spirulina sp.]